MRKRKIEQIGWKEYQEGERKGKEREEDKEKVRQWERKEKEGRREGG